MKKIKMIALALIAMLTSVVSVNAATVEVDTTDELLDAVTKSGDIKLVGNVELGEFTGKKITIATGIEINLDLNGYVISGKSTNEKISTALIQNNGKLTIEDNSSTKTGKITLTDNEVGLGAYAYGIFTINNEGDLVVNSGTIENTGRTDVPYPIDNNTTNRNATVTINGGTILGSKAGIRAFCNSTKNENKIIINGGTITAGNSAVWISQVSKKANKGYLEVNGGTITGIKNNGIYVSVFDQSLMENISVKFTGGTIKNNSETSATFMYEPWVSDSDLANAVLNLDITGGTFINENAKGSAFHQFPNIPVTYTNIVGGTFSSDVTKYVKEGYVSKLVNGNYVVAVEKAVKLAEITNGVVTVDKTKAIIGEEVTITATPNEGYELVTLKVVDADNNELEIVNNKFVMPNKEVTVSAIFNKVTVETEIETVDPTEPVEEVTVGIKDSEETKDVLLESLNETLKNVAQKELAEALNNSSAIVKVEIANIDKTTIEEEIKDIEEAVGDSIIATYFDITVAVKNASDGNTLGTIPELTKEIELMILLPEELKNVDKDVTRKYYVIRRHINANGKVEVEKLDAVVSEDGKSLSFKTDKFSTYALAYSDETIKEEANKNNETTEKNVDTSDNGNTYVIIGMLSILSILATLLYVTKKNQVNA